MLVSTLNLAFRPLAVHVREIPLNLTFKPLVAAFLKLSEHLCGRADKLAAEGSVIGFFAVRQQIPPPIFVDKILEFFTFSINRMAITAYSAIHIGAKLNSGKNP